MRTLTEVCDEYQTCDADHLLGTRGHSHTRPGGGQLTILKYVRLTGALDSCPFNHIGMVAIRTIRIYYTTFYLLVTITDKFAKLLQQEKL